MDLSEYNLKISEINKESEKKKMDLTREFCLSHNTIKLGDVCGDNVGSIIVDKIQIAMGFFKTPCCVYTGRELQKNGNPYKKERIRSVWQTNLI